jgi:hypothetical protein
MQNRQHWLDPILQELHPCGIYFRHGLPIACVTAIDNNLPWLRRLPAELSTHPVFAWLEGLRISTWRPDDLRFLAALRNPRMASVAFLHIDNLLWTGTQWNSLSKARPVLRVRSARVFGHPGEDYGQALARCAIFEGVRSLNMQGGYPRTDDAALKGLSHAPWLSTVTHLTLAGGQFGPDGLRSLLTSPWLGNLKDLNLACNPIGDEGAELLAQCARLTSLTRLSLRMTGISSRGTQALARSPYLRSLQCLSLDRCNPGEAGVEALAASPILANVQKLAVDGLSDSAVSVLSRSRVLGALEELNLSLAAESKDALEFLGRSSAMPNLRYLSVAGNTISQAAFESLTFGQGFKNVGSLHMAFLTLGPDYCTPNPDRVRLFADPACLPALKSLDLSVPDYDLDTLGEVLARSAMFRRLRRLTLGWAGKWKESLVDGLCRLLDEGNLEDLSVPAPAEGIMKRLADSPGLHRLIRLRLWSIKSPQQRSLKALVCSPHLTRLGMLDLSACRRRSAIKVLPQARLPALVWLDIAPAAEDEETLLAFSQQRPNVYLRGFRSHTPWALDTSEPML